MENFAPFCSWLSDSLNKNECVEMEMSPNAKKEKFSFQWQKIVPLDHNSLVSSNLFLVPLQICGMPPPDYPSGHPLLMLPHAQ